MQNNNLTKATTTIIICSDFSMPRKTSSYQAWAFVETRVQRFGWCDSMDCMYVVTL